MATAEVSDPRNGSKRRRSSPSGSPASANSLIDEPPIKRSRNQDPGQGLNEISVTVSDHLNATCVIVAESPGKVALANLVAAVESIVDVIRVAETTRENDSDCEYLKILIQNLKDLSLNPAAGSRVDKGRIDDLKKELTEINDQYHETCVNTHLHPCTNINSTGVIVALKSALQHTLQYLMQNPFLGESIGHGSAATIVANSSIDVSIPSLFGSSSKEIILNRRTATKALV
ncbi:hypothetical protein FRC03_005851 [Tulasnella sp. 419]|nr:hypothetical protein FRC03_005851 [Tulasnella sp. 419]